MKKRKGQKENIYDLAPHETMLLTVNGGYWWITRVPGGWVYKSSGSAVFVPMVKESPGDFENEDVPGGYAPAVWGGGTGDED